MSVSNLEKAIWIIIQNQMARHVIYHARCRHREEIENIWVDVKENDALFAGDWGSMPGEAFWSNYALATEKRVMDTLCGFGSARISPSRITAATRCPCNCWRPRLSRLQVTAKVPGDFGIHRAFWFPAAMKQTGPPATGSGSATAEILCWTRTVPGSFCIFGSPRT